MDEVHEFVSETLYTAKCVRCEERSYFKLDGQYLTKKPARAKKPARTSRARGTGGGTFCRHAPGHRGDRVAGAAW